MTRSFSLLMIAGIVLIGLGHLLILPPFEGFDETAHYSSIQQIEETGTIPVNGNGFMSREVADYRGAGPMPYNVTIAHLTAHPDLVDTRITYPEFFASPTLVKSYREQYRMAGPRAPYEPAGDEINWEVQHPPFYYLVMAPVMNATYGLPFVTQFFVMRLLSFSMAVAGLLLSWRGTVRYADDDAQRRYLTMGFLLYPLIMPMFFLEFGRLGNDSLCLLLLAFIWMLLLPWLRDLRQLRYAVPLGLLFGVGLWTKSFFLPTLGGLTVFLLLRLWHERKKKLLVPGLLAVISMNALAILVGGWWYYLEINYMEGTSFGWAVHVLRGDNGILAALPDKFSVSQFFVAIGRIFESWSWFTSWSSVRMPFIFRVPVLLLMVCIFIGYASVMVRRAPSSEIWLPAWIVTPLLAVLIVWNTFTYVSQGENFTGGWYLHILAPAVALALGYGIARIGACKYARYAMLALLFYNACFLIMVFWAQATLYAGCSVRNSNSYYESFYRFPDGGLCLDQIGAVAANLGVLGWPYAAAVAFGAGFLCLVTGLWKMRGFLPPSSNRTAG